MKGMLTGIPVSGSMPQEKDSEGFVAVKGAIMGANNLLFSNHMSRSGFT